MKPNDVLVVVFTTIAHIHFQGCVAGNFEYDSFNDTTGIVFVGSAATSTCEQSTDPEKDFAYGCQPRHGAADVDGQSIAQQLNIYGPNAVGTTSSVSAPEGHTEMGDIDAAFGHRDASMGGFEKAPENDCALRIRLTPSEPFQRGAIWRSGRVQVTRGFDTEFSFQITDQTQSCSVVRDPSFGTKRYRSCRVHGGDGIAFVIQANNNGTNTLGKNGGHMGYAGVSNLVAIEFDSWFNAELGDSILDHVSVQAEIHGSKTGDTDGDTVTTAGTSSSLHPPREYPFADGRVHHVRVAYFPDVDTDFVPYFVAGVNIDKFIVANDGENQLGTLAVWIDHTEEPLLALPFNLGAALGSVDGEAVVGFTSATGSSWEKHDLLSWSFCEDLDACNLGAMRHTPSAAGSVQTPPEEVDYARVDQLNKMQGTVHSSVHL